MTHHYIAEELNIKGWVAYHSLICLALYLLDRPLWRYAVWLGMGVSGFGIVMLSR